MREFLIALVLSGGFVPPELDPFRTVYVCRDGENGGTVEPTGDDSNTGLMGENGLPNPVLTLRRAAEILNSKEPGWDLALCEGGEWVAEPLAIRHYGDIGDRNRAMVAMQKARRVASRPGGGDLYYWMAKNAPWVELPRMWTPHFEVPGFDRSEVDYTTIHGYKIVDGETKKLEDPKSFCSIPGDHDCYDPLSWEYVASGWQPPTE